MKIINLIILCSIFSSVLLLSSFIAPKLNVEAESEKTESFQEFLEKFEHSELPFEIGINDFHRYMEYRDLDSFYYVKPMYMYTFTELELMDTDSLRNIPSIYGTSFIPESYRSKFSRRGPRDVIRPIAKFYPNEKMVAVIFATSPRPFSYIPLKEDYKLIVYDLDGERIFPQVSTSSKMTRKERNESESFLLARTSKTETITCQIDKKGKIWKNTYENVWKDDVKKKGFRKNKMIGFEIKNSDAFQFNEKGIIGACKQFPTVDRASID